MNGKFKIYILAEHHPSNLKALSLMSAYYASREIIESFHSVKSIDDIDEIDLDGITNEITSSVDVLLCAHDIINEEFKLLEHLISTLPSPVIYLEGNEETNKYARPEIIKLARERNLKLIYLDEGNPRYEKMVDENGRILKHTYEIQKGRENYWIRRIEETKRDSERGIAIVGVDHVRYDPIRKIYGILKPKYRYVGYFDKKLRKRGYEVEIFEFTCW
jgi:hypothetical protein